MEPRSRCQSTCSCCSFCRIPRRSRRCCDHVTHGRTSSRLPTVSTTDIVRGSGSAVSDVGHPLLRCTVLAYLCSEPAPPSPAAIPRLSRAPRPSPRSRSTAPTRSPTCTESACDTSRLAKPSWAARLARRWSVARRRWRALRAGRGERWLPARPCDGALVLLVVFPMRSGCRLAIRLPRGRRPRPVRSTGRELRQDDLVGDACVVGQQERLAQDQPQPLAVQLRVRRHRDVTAAPAPDDAHMSGSRPVHPYYRCLVSHQRTANIPPSLPARSTLVRASCWRQPPRFSPRRSMGRIGWPTGQGCWALPTSPTRPRRSALA